MVNVKKKTIIVSIILMLFITIIYVIVVKKAKCPPDYYLENGVCYKTEKKPFIKTNYCEEGFELIDNMCQKTELIEAKKDYDCINYKDNTSKITVSEPILIGSKCKYTLSFEAVSISYCEYSFCYLETEDTCQCRIELPASVNGYGQYERKFCIDGYLKGDVCVINRTISSKKFKSCIDGFYLSGDTCISEEYYDAILITSCPNGYKQNGSYCERVLKIEPMVKYSCESGFEKMEDGCYRTVS